MRNFLLFLLVCNLFAACSVSSRISGSAQKILLRDSALQTAHVGISIYEPATGKWWYNYQGDKYFVPASNVKLATCYAAMKYLGDSLVGARFIVSDDGAIELFPSGDPTFLHPNFQYQPVFEKAKQYKVMRWGVSAWQEQHWGNGWSWDDYGDDYMAERSPLPIYGNLTRISLQGDTLIWSPFPESISFDTALGYLPKSNYISRKNFSVERGLNENRIYLKSNTQHFTSATIPIRMEVSFVSKLLEDTLRAENVSAFSIAPNFIYKQTKATIRSQPTDSLLRPMMHRSDNFFAEQSLLMVSNERLGFMNDEKIIDTLLKTDFKDLPQKPHWADGSGLSRYNLFTPQDFVAILQKMERDFGASRIKNILPTGNEGTLSNYYKTDSTFLYAKTGTLSGVVALSGFLTTKGGKELIFSVLVNNHNASATRIRRAVEKFIQHLRNKY